MHVDNGMAAIKAAKTEKIDLVLLDLLLPDIDGNEVCRWLKLNHDTKAIPIIMLTAKGESNDKVAGLEAGADDYLQKPFDENELNATDLCAAAGQICSRTNCSRRTSSSRSMLTQVETLAIMDSLTGLFNRRRFETILSNEFKKSLRYQHPLSLHDDRYRSFQGDQRPLRPPGGRRGAAGSGPVHSGKHPRSGHSGALGRRRICRDQPEHDQRQLLCRAPSGFLNRLPTTSSPVIKHRVAKVTVSIGVAGIPDPQIDTAEKLIHAADLALYEAKRKGRARVEAEGPQIGEKEPTK